VQCCHLDGSCDRYTKMLHLCSKLIIVLWLILTISIKTHFKIWPMPQSRSDWIMTQFLFINSTCSEPNVQITLPKTSGLQIYFPKPLDIISQPSSKVEDDRWTPANAADDLEQPASDSCWQSCKEVQKWPKARCEAKGGHFEHSQWL